MEVSQLVFEKQDEMNVAPLLGFFGYLFLPDETFIKITQDCYIIEEMGQYSAVDKYYYEAFLVKHQVPTLPDPL